MVLSKDGNLVFRDVNGDGAYSAAEDGTLRGQNSSYAFDNVQDDLTLNGSLQWDMNPLVLRIGGSYNSYTYSGAGLPIQGMFNTRRHETANQNYLLNTKMTYFLNTSTYLRVNFSTVGRRYESYDKAFKEKGIFEDGHKSELADWLKFCLLYTSDAADE